MKKSERTNSAIRNNGVDRISNLPDPILHSILSRLPETEEVVRTSILSTRWRYLWTSIKSLDIDCIRGFKPSKTFKKHKFEEFVYSVLLNQTLDLDSFRLRCMNYYKMSTIWRWVQAAVMRKVKFLDLTFCPISKFEDVELPNCLVMCESLVALKLYLFDHKLLLPNFKGFLALKVLELNSVELSDGYLVKKLLKSCPLLEDLSLYDCVIFQLLDFTISCPNLKTLRLDNRKSYGEIQINGGYCNGLEIYCPKLVFLEYAGHIAYMFDFKVDSLKKAVLCPQLRIDHSSSPQSLVNTIFDLFAGVSHVESLSLNLSFAQWVAAPRDPNGVFPACLPNLKTLEITTSLDANTMNVVVMILKASPNLKRFNLIILTTHENHGS
ncbi:FBD-associated F-box protein At2g26860-like isoform X2 [Rutidosis leptorrhynchoides]|uniref:FBD-associated F-box protein At2g26860-like isoform X2 n=1 Tax=Rutidosis leptorrhynchoides TaxID=125765 RepID=UPI003A9996F4